MAMRSLEDLTRADCVFFAQRELLNESCAVRLLDSLITSAISSDSQVLYRKMKGDLLRYLVKFKIGDEWQRAADEAMSSYKMAQAFHEALRQLTAGLHFSNKGALYINLFMDRFCLWTSNAKTLQIQSPPMVPTLDKLTREDYSYLAMVAESCKRYEEMVQFMRKLVLKVTPAGELTRDEFHLLLKAYQYVSSCLLELRSWIPYKQTTGLKDDGVALTEYRCMIETGVSPLFNSFLHLLDFNLLPSAKSTEDKVLYQTCKAETLGWLAELRTGDQRPIAIKKAIGYYHDAQEPPDES